MSSLEKDTLSGSCFHTQVKCHVINALEKDLGRGLAVTLAVSLTLTVQMQGRVYVCHPVHTALSDIMLRHQTSAARDLMAYTSVQFSVEDGIYALGIKYAP